MGKRKKAAPGTPFGAQLKTFRESEEIPATAIAEAAGWTKQHVHRLERAESMTEKSFRAYLRALEELGCTVEFTIRKVR